MITQAVILAGGLGTRLRSVLADRPKPMALVDGRPLLEHLLVALREHGVTRAILCIGHLGHVIEEHFGDGVRVGMELRYAREHSLLGTAGAIGNARPHLHPGSFLAMNGDTMLAGLDFTDLAEVHQDRRQADRATVGTIVVVRPHDAGAYGVIDLDRATGRILGFREKAPVDPATAVISGGVYALEPQIMEHIAAGRPVSIETEVFPRLIASGRRLWAHVHDGFFGDIGTPPALSAFAPAPRTRRTGRTTACSRE